MKRKLIISSDNKHKIHEIENILGDFFEVFPKHSLENPPDIEETGSSFLDNARLKAIGLSQYTDEWVLADDSGIEVDALNGKPGIYSARFAGANATDNDNNQKLLELLHHVPLAQRSAHYRCVMVLAHQGEQLAIGEGSCSGIILEKYQGEGGFGYDPLFWDPHFKKTFAEISQEEKDKISHRRNALENLLSKIQDLV